MISLLSKELSRVFSNTTVQKHQFFIVRPITLTGTRTGTKPGPRYRIAMGLTAHVNSQVRGRHRSMPRSQIYSQVRHVHTRSQSRRQYTHTAGLWANMNMEADASSMGHGR